MLAKVKRSFHFIKNSPFISSFSLKLSLIGNYFPSRRNILDLYCRKKYKQNVQ